MMGSIRAGILISSDRSYQGIRPDTSGPALAEHISTLGWSVQATALVPDEIEAIKEVLVDWSDTQGLDLILISGGTGFAPRDVTPEATLAVVQRETPGLSEVMRASSLKVTPHAMLSRAVSGIRGRTLIIDLPGSPKAAVENLQAIESVLPHAVELLRGDPGAEAGHRVNP
jgi:molybdopterin adenylyltransferase